MTLELVTQAAQHNASAAEILLKLETTLAPDDPSAVAIRSALVQIQEARGKLRIFVAISGTLFPSAPLPQAGAAPHS